MSDQLPRLGGLPEPEKYERLVERMPGLWWSDAGPFAGLHELNAVRVEYFRAVFNGFGGKRVLDVGCGGGILAEALRTEAPRVTGTARSNPPFRPAAAPRKAAGLPMAYRPAPPRDWKTAGPAGR